MNIADRAKSGTWLSLILGLCFLVSACTQKAPTDAALGVNGGPVTPGSQREFTARVGDTVYFDTDSSQLSADAQNTLRGQAQWLRSYPQYTITIEGHADERGTREYNIALGAQRASATRQFLISHGVNPGRIQTISYGKERPVAVCDNISCWSQNRRAVTVLSGGARGPVASY